MIKTIIIEDERDAQELLSSILQQYCPNIEIVAIAGDLNHGIQVIESYQPDLVFLDIQLGEHTGFQLLDQLKDSLFQLIITTAYQDSALKAFRYQALDYVLKPYSPSSIMTAVERVKMKPSEEGLFEKLDLLLNKTQASPKICLPSEQGVVLVNYNQIIRVEASRAYSFVHLVDGTKIIVSKSLKIIESMLPRDIFFRIHSSHLINLNRVGKYFKEDGGYAVMTDNTQVPIARRRKIDFLNWINPTCSLY